MKLIQPDGLDSTRNLQPFIDGARDIDKSKERFLIEILSTETPGGESWRGNFLLFFPFLFNFRGEVSNLELWKQVGIHSGFSWDSQRFFWAYNSVLCCLAASPKRERKTERERKRERLLKEFPSDMMKIASRTTCHCS